MLTENTICKDPYGYLEMRYGSPFAQSILDDMKLTEDRPPAITDAKELFYMAERYRAHATQAVKRLKEWRNRPKHVGLQDGVIRLEGELLENQLKDAWTLYRTTHRLYWSIYRVLMAQFMAGSYQA